RCLSREALRRAATTRRDCTQSGDATGSHALRRADITAGSPARRRGVQCHARTRSRRHDTDRRNAFRAIRERRGMPGFEVRRKYVPLAVENSLRLAEEENANQYFVRSLFFSPCRSMASVISRSISSEYGIPDASHNFGYMLMEVNPGSVLISLT